MDYFAEAIKEIRSLSRDMRKTKTAFSDLVEEGVVDTSDAATYMEDLYDEEPAVAEKVAQVLKRNKTASVGFGSADHAPKQVKTTRGSSKSSFAEADLEFCNIDFGG